MWWTTPVVALLGHLCEREEWIDLKKWKVFVHMANKCAITHEDNLIVSTFTLHLNVLKSVYLLCIGLFIILICFSGGWWLQQSVYA